METKSKGLISVVVPIHISLSSIDKLRQHINYATTPIEVIFVIDKKCKTIIEEKEPYEKTIYIHNKGRGYTLVEGARRATGDVIVFLHSDTYLPNGWDISIRNALQNHNIIGGGFSLEFDYKSTFLTILIFTVTFLHRFTHILSGDRAIFVRANPLKYNLEVLEVPIMEDAELSRWMKKRGKVIILKEKVTTSANTFLKYGMFHNTWRIFKCTIMYIFGGDLQRIYDFYYSK